MPLVIREILIHSHAVDYLEKRGLVRQYLKAKKYILSGNFEAVRIKLREPKSDGIWYFRINRQYRAHARYEDGILGIFHIDDHSK